MLTVVVGLACAFSYGSADFLGGLAARRMRPVVVTVISSLSGLAALLLAVPFVPSAFGGDAVLLGVLAGVATAVAITLLYACLAIGPMSILSPVTAVVAAVVPVGVGLARGERLGPLGLMALGVIVVAIVLVGLAREEGAARPTLRGLAMAVTSGAFLGTFFLLLDLTDPESGLAPLVAARGTTGALLGLILAAGALAARQRGARSRGVAASGPSASDVSARRALTLALACGVIDAASNVLLLVGLRIGDLTVVSVLAALYPAGTVVLAALVLRERLARLQVVGLVLAIAGAGALAVG